MIHAELLLHGDGGGRKGVVGRRGGHDDEVDVGGRQAGIGERRARRLGGEVGGELAIGGDVALADAGALRDPLVGRIDDPVEIVIGQNLRRADSRRSPAPPTEDRSHAHPLRRSFRTTSARAWRCAARSLIDLVEESVAGHAVADFDGGGEAFRRRCRRGF